MTKMKLSDCQNNQDTFNTFSLENISLGTMQTDAFTEMVNKLAAGNFDKINLGGTDLSKLSFDQCKSLFDAIQKNSPKEINLSNNNFKKLLLKNKNYFIQFFKNFTAEIIYLNNNYLDDESAAILAKHCRFKTIQLFDNLITDKGALKFSNNLFLSNINLSFNYVSISVKNQILKDVKKIKEEKFIEEVFATAPGIKSGESPFSLLPKEIFIHLLTFLGQHLRAYDHLVNISTLIVNNVVASTEGKLVWKKNLIRGINEIPIFRTRTYFFAVTQSCEDCDSAGDNMPKPSTVSQPPFPS